VKNRENAMASPHANKKPEQPQAEPQASAQVIPLRPPGRWHDPLKLIQDEPPSQFGRIVLCSVSILIFLLIVWAAFGQLDITASAEGKLVPQTLVKIVQPAEAGVIRELPVGEGDSVRKGQVLARLDPTLARADKEGIATDLAIQQMQVRRIQAQLDDEPMLPKAGDAPALYAQVHGQYLAHRKAYLDSLEQEQSLLLKAEHERRSAAEILAKLEQTLPTYRKSAQAFARLEQDGFIGAIAAAEKEREALEKEKDRDAQRATVAALDATIAAQRKRIEQIRSTYKSELQRELADARARIAQLEPSLDKTRYREGLMELHAPQDGVVKDLATTTTGAVVQPGAILMTLVPQDEALIAEVAIRNEDVGFVRVGQTARIKVMSYPFQKYGMLTGKVIRLSADATETGKAGTANGVTDTTSSTAGTATYKARIRLDSQILKDPQGVDLVLTPGMQVVAEINQGKRTVLEYLLSPVEKTVQEAGRER